MKHPFLVGHRVYLKGLESEDLAGQYFQWFNDQEVCAFNSHGYFPNNSVIMHDFLEKIHSSETNLVLAIVVKKGDMHIGNISLQNIDWISRSAEFAIIIGEKSFWGKGYSKEAADLIIEHGFSNLNLNRIYCGTAMRNVAMQKLAEHMGMKKEGVRRQGMFKRGEYVDIYEYGLLKDEYLEMKKGARNEKGK